MSDRYLRERHDDLDSAVGRITTGDSNCADAALLTTTTVTTYPTAAAAFFACNPTQIDGAPTEGTAATYSADGDQVVYALNVGSQVPPPGTRVVAHTVGGRSVFRYDG